MATSDSHVAPLRRRRTLALVPDEARDGKLVVVVIPALNEQETIGAVVRAIPRELPGVSRVDVVIVDDGSSDETGARARAAGADEVIRHARNRGLAAAFTHGVSAALARGADVVVHLDADGQHDPRFMPAVVAPILAGDAEVVIGARPFAEAHSMGAVRRQGNRLGSWLLRRAVHVSVSDFTSGYRAFSREALLAINVVSDYTYTLETLIQAARKRLAVAEVTVPVVSRAVGESRMTRSVVRYVQRAGMQAMRTMLHENPLAIFGRGSLVMLLVAAVATAQFVWGYNRDHGLHLPALLAALLATILAVGLFLSGLIADGINSSRRLGEDALYRIKRLELGPASVDTRELPTGLWRPRG
jgi:glycosyltransferase involved in cell wall biosynthesis